jgi:hypothetical protein
LELYLKSLSWCQNFIISPQGGADFRPGSTLVGLTAGNGNARLIPFQYSAGFSIMIVATNKKFRFYFKGAACLQASTTISGITNANPGVVTSTSHGLTTGQEVYITGVVGMPQINNRFFIVGTTTTNTFQLKDQWGNTVDTTAYGTWTSGGTVAAIYELATPYFVADIPYIRTAQYGATMYIACQNPNNYCAYEPLKLTLNSNSSVSPMSGSTWTFGTFSRTNDPFAAQSTLTPTAISQANPAVATVASTAGWSNGTVVYITGVVGMTQLNGNFYQITVVDGTHVSLQDLNGNNIDSTGYTAYSSGGLLTSPYDWPRTVAFTPDARLAYACTFRVPNGYWSSQTPNSTTNRFDDFTAGSAATNALMFAAAPDDSSYASIVEIKQFGSAMAVLMTSSIRLFYGATQDAPPNPTQINSKQLAQGAQSLLPVVINWNLIFCDDSAARLRGVQYNLAFSTFEAINYNLASSHFGEESIYWTIARTRGISDTVWVLRQDGVLLAFTFNNIENIAGWSRNIFGGSAKVLDIAVVRVQNPTTFRITDQLWMCVQRTINGNTYTSIEMVNQAPLFPHVRQFFGKGANKAADLALWQNASWEVVRNSNFLDMALQYDGRSRGTTAGATITPSATSGNITITASQSVFQASDVGTEIWKNYDSTGAGGGRALITGYTDSTHVTATTYENFDNTNAVAAGSWGFATKTLVNLQWFEGQTMQVTVDGSPHPNCTVTGGKITLQNTGEVVNVGFGYTGLMATQNLDFGGRLGPGHSKPRNVKRVRARLKDSMGGEVGTDEYATTPMQFRLVTQPMDRPPPPFNGMKEVNLTDNWTNDTKQVVVKHTQPVPLTVLALDIEGATNEPV